MKRNIIISFIAASLFFPGCASDGKRPLIDPVEKQHYAEALQKRRLDYFFDQAIQVNSLGYKILRAVPKESGKMAMLPVLYADLRKENAGVYPMAAETGVFVAGKLNGFGLEDMDIQRGDVISSVAGKSVSSESQINNILKETQQNRPETVPVTFIRSDGTEREHHIPVVYVGKKSKFVVSGENLTVNAYTNGLGTVTISTAMLRFAKSDDELAFILAHEIAHQTQGHIVKKTVNDVIAAMAGITLGALVEAYVPYTGNTVAQTTASIVQSPYSQDLEREADYYGLQYLQTAGYDVKNAKKIWERFSVELPGSNQGSIVSTHPTSVERFVRLDKSVEEISSR